MDAEVDYQIIMAERKFPKVGIWSFRCTWTIVVCLYCFVLACRAARVVTGGIVPIDGSLT